MSKLFFGSLVLSFLAAGSSFADTPKAPIENPKVSEKSPSPPTTRLDRSEFQMCRSEIQNESTKFYNVGSMCVDGLFALMEGRGCENIVHERIDDDWTNHYCATDATCDRLHNSVFSIVSVDVDMSRLSSDPEVWCMDNNYVVIRQPIENGTEE